MALASYHRNKLFNPLLISPNNFFQPLIVKSIYYILYSIMIITFKTDSIANRFFFYFQIFLYNFRDIIFIIFHIVIL